MKIKTLIIVVNLLLTSCASYHHHLLYKKNPAFYAYIIGDAKSEHIDEAYAADVYATPASCLKTITALVALKSLGSDYRYTTKLFMTKQQQFIRDIIISFSGDPTFTSEDLLTLLKPLKGTKINGKIILDASAFKTPPHSQNIMLDDIGSDFAQPVSSVNIDKNLITVKILPTQIGKLAVAKGDASYQIDSSVITTAETSAIKLTWDGNVIKATGSVNVTDLSLQSQLSPREIYPYSMSKVKNVLKLLDIKGSVKIIQDENNLPSHMILVNKVESKPLKNFISPAMKASDNFVFDSLYLTIIHAQLGGKVKNWKDGDKVIKALMWQYYAIDLDKALLVDGSGLSRYNRIQPKKLLALLRKGFLIPEFVDALPKPGEEKSTLRKRTNLPSNVRAKTGTVSGISCLCGYSSNADTAKVFVIMASSFAPPSKELLNVIDEFIKDQLGA